MSSEATITRTRVLRGAAAAAIVSTPLTADLGLLRPAPRGGAATAEALDAAHREAKEAAARVGYEDGFAAGVTAGTEQGAARAAELETALLSALGSLESAAAGLSQRQAATIMDVERQVATLAVEIAAAVIGRELATVDSGGVDAIARALRLAPERADAVARLHPEDAAVVGVLPVAAGDRGVTVVADPSVERGGCLLDVGPCRIDAQISSALDRVREVLGA